MNARITFLIIIILGYPFFGFSEGTKQIKPFSLAEGELCLDKSRNNFACYNAAPEFRLNIYIADTTEKICFGFGMITIPDSLLTIEFQIKDPSGNIVYGAPSIPSPGIGYIETYQQAITGPFFSVGGYDPMIYHPVSTGNFYLEFYYPPDNMGNYQEDNRIQFKYFDITVVNNAGKAIDGRVWSKAWQFNSGILQAPPTTSRFYGKMYILSDDSIVSQLDCNGFVGGTFSISSNATGCATTGNLLVDRLSKEGFHTYPQYKVFLNDPDSVIFPTGKFSSIMLLSDTVVTDCATGSVDFGVKVVRDGTVELLIDVDPSLNPDSRDVRLTSNVLANPGGTGYNIIHWDGHDNSGTPVPNGTLMECNISFVCGLTHLPIYDIEYNDNGYKVFQIRPKGSQLMIFWDDTQIPGGDASTVTGCNDLAGCHIWSDSAIGNMNTINSWWYVNRNSIPSIPFTILSKPGKPGPIDGPFSVCRSTYGNQYSVPAEASSTQYFWSFSGSGAIIHDNGLSIIIDFSDSATSGTLSIYGRNPDCGDGLSSSVAITVNPIPVVTLSTVDTVCFNIPGFNLTGGSPTGGNYFIDGNTSEVFQPMYQSPGSHTIVYSYTSAEGCTSSDTTVIIVKNDQECAPVIYFPNAFSPNGDGLNDTYKPVTKNILKFIMEIYSRSGELVYTSNDPNNGWDGTFKGNRCPNDVYVFKATCLISLINNESKTITGTVTITR